MCRIDCVLKLRCIGSFKAPCSCAAGQAMTRVRALHKIFPNMACVTKIVEYIYSGTQAMGAYVTYKTLR